MGRPRPATAVLGPQASTIDGVVDARDYHFLRADASLTPLQTAAHGSGSMRIVFPDRCRTCTNSLPVSPAGFSVSPTHCERLLTLPMLVPKLTEALSLEGTFPTTVPGRHQLVREEALDVRTFKPNVPTGDWTWALPQQVPPEPEGRRRSIQLPNCRRKNGSSPLRSWP